MRSAALPDLAQGQEIPVVEVEIDRAALVRYAGASDDYTYVHWDQPRMLAEGHPDVVVHGWLTFAYMCQAVTDWAPPELADISSYAVRYRRPSFPGRLSCGGRVTAVREADGRRLVDLELWSKDAEGALTTTATMTLRIV